MKIEPVSRTGRAWSPEHDEQLKKLVLANLSFRDAVTAINADHGTTFSRSAAIGRANRLGLCSPMPKAERALRKTHRVEKLLEAKRQQREAKPLREPNFKADLAEAAAPFAGVLNLTLTDLFDLSGERPNQCRAIEGEVSGDTLYCGVATRPGRPWCDYHHASYCQKPEPRLHSADANRRGRKVSNFTGSYEEA